MNRDHRRLLALFLALFGMAWASSAHAGSLCTAGGDGAALCDLTSSSSPPPGIDSASLYDTHRPLPSLVTGEPSDPGAGIVLAGQGPVAEPAPLSGLLLGRAWSVNEHDAEPLVSLH